MDLIQANILNKYCGEHPEALLVISQANRSLSVYYENAKGVISHKFGGVKKLDSTHELEPGCIWVNLAKFTESYRKLLKYFHPDIYKGKRTNEELTKVIELLNQIKRTSKDHPHGTIHQILSGMGYEPPHECIDPNYFECSFLGILRCGDPIGQLREWCEAYRFDQRVLYNDDLYEAKDPDWFRALGMEDRRRYSQPYIHNGFLKGLRELLPEWWGKDYAFTPSAMAGHC